MPDIGGPYCNSDGEWWVAVEDASYLVARREVKSCVWEPGDRLVYLGREMAWLCTTEGCDTDDPAEHDIGCRNVMAWHFEEVER